MLPGGLVLGVALYGKYGWPQDEPGATFLVALLSAAFMLGHIVAALANWLAPLAWGKLPGSDPPSQQGLFDKKGHLHGKGEADALKAFNKLLGPQPDLDRAIKAGAKRMRAEARGKMLSVYNEQIGFYRNSATACLVATLIVVVYELTAVGTPPMPAAFWVPALLVACLLFTGRYRRFWRYYAREVWLDVSQASKGGSRG